MSSSNWWASKIGTPTPTPQSTPIYTPPTPTPYIPPAQPPRTTEAAPTASRCPGCGSGNYGRSNMAPEAKARCYDCGYPVVQSGSGVGTGISQPGGGPAIPARQISTANNYNPQTIIGHI